ncbi:MAG TPA: glycoside hydrolase family 5 protein [Lacunisphaera sp.]|nr:glycoside hydrolase family 5 protein [Lacunisphaera sp.]
MKPSLPATVALLLVLAGCATTGVNPPAPPAAGPVSAHGLLRAEGNRIVDASGQPVSLAGVSYGWSQWEAARFYNAGTVGWLKDDWHAAIVRAPLGLHEEDGYLQHPDRNLQRVTRVIDAALSDDLYVLVDWHDHHANQHTDLAIAFFQDIARRYGTHANIIYEIFNEPIRGLTWAGDVKPYAEKVVAAIRAIDPDNLIVIGTPNYSQDVEVAAADPVRAANVAYALHFYAATHKQELRDKAVRALNLGAPLFVTEWGSGRADGAGQIDEGSTRAWMDFIRERKLSHCTWGVYDKAETAALVRRSAASRGGWSDADLSPSGRLARTIIRAWPNPPAN